MTAHLYFDVIFIVATTYIVVKTATGLASTTSKWAEKIVSFFHKTIRSRANKATLFFITKWVALFLILAIGFPLLTIGGAESDMIARELAIEVMAQEFVEYGAEHRLMQIFVWYCCSVYKGAVIYHAVQATVSLVIPYLIATKPDIIQD